MKQIILNLDDDDEYHVRQAIKARLNCAPMPDSDSNRDGKAIAEICRGWGEQAGFLNWTDALKRTENES